MTVRKPTREAILIARHEPMTHAVNVANCRREVGEILRKPDVPDFSKPSLAIEGKLTKANVSHFFPEQSARGHVTDRDLSAAEEVLGIAGDTANRLLTDANAANPEFLHKYARVREERLGQSGESRVRRAEAKGGNGTRRELSRKVKVQGFFHA